MKKKLSIVLAIIAVVMVFTGCKNGNNNSKVVNAEKKKGDTFTVGFDAEYPPYGYKNSDGEYTGFDLELAQEVCNRCGWKLKKQPIDWDAKDMEINSGSIDCIWNGMTMTGRENEYTYSNPYVDNSVVFVVLKKSDIDSISDLKGKKVDTQADSSAYNALTKQEDNEKNLKIARSFSSLEQVADFNTAFLNLESGVCDAIAVDVGVAQYQLKSRDSLFKKIEEPLSKEEYAVAFKKGNTKLKNQVQKVLDGMYKDGTVDKIATKYNDYNLKDMLCMDKFVK